MRIKLMAIFTAAASTFVLSGCGDNVTDPTPENYAKAINAGLEKRGCLGIGFASNNLYSHDDVFPVKIDRDGKDVEVARALEAAGLVTLKADKAHRMFDIVTRPLRDVYTVELTDAGKKALKSADRRYFCICDREVERIESAEDPVEVRGRRFVKVTYSWKAVNARDWTKTEAASALPEVKETLAGGSGMRISLKLMKEGWVW